VSGSSLTCLSPTDYTRPVGLSDTDSMRNLALSQACRSADAAGLARTVACHNRLRWAQTAARKEVRRCRTIAYRVQASYGCGYPVTNVLRTLSSSFALFRGVFFTIRSGVRRGFVTGVRCPARQLAGGATGQPARLRNSMIWASCFLASLLDKGSVQNLSSQLSRRSVVSMSANDGSCFFRYQGRSGKRRYRWPVW
jgi:hypothetical protein